MAKTYEGTRTTNGTVVTVDGRALNPRGDLYNYSPDGFEWGYGGSGPAQLALAILADHLNDDQTAIKHYQRFKSAVIAKISENHWTLTGDHVAAALNQ